jgi:hypothetical protein
MGNEERERRRVEPVEVAFFLALCAVLIIAGIVLWPAAMEDARRLLGR